MLDALFGKDKTVMRTKRGFTLLELLIVVVILGVLALIAAPNLLDAVDQAKNAAVMANQRAAASSITTRFDLKGETIATDVAADVVAELNTESVNPIDDANPAFATAGTAPGSVVLAGDDANALILIIGYDKDGAMLFSKTMRAPESIN